MASRALETYDTDADGRIAGEELDSVPGLKKYIALYDQNGNGAISGEELRTRFSGWKEQGLALRRLDIRLSLNGQPLRSATITFVPESYMPESVKQATGTTDSSGLAKMSVAPEDLPESLQKLGGNVRGVYVGTFKIEITHPSINLADVYESGAALGEEIARDTVAPSIQLSLSTEP